MSPTRFAFLDVLRGVAIILMVINHTSRWWLDASLRWPRYWLVYGSMLLPAALFLFLVGFCLPIPMRRTAGAPLPSFVRTMPRYARRGAQIIVAGLVLNVLVFPEDSWWSGGVLQTIGAAVILVAPAMWIVRYAWGRALLLALAVGGYVGYFLAFPTLRAWSRAHKTLAEIVFLDFPPWPWISAALIGLVLGWWWLDARERGEEAERKYFSIATVVGITGLAAYGLWEWWLPTTPGFGFPRDLMLNNHWTPRGATNFYVIGGVATLLAASYWLTEMRRLQLRWLVILGQTALVIYFIHQIFAYTLVNQILGVRFRNWWIYGAENVLFMVVLLGFGTGWIELRRRVRDLLARRRGVSLAGVGNRAA